MRSHKGFTLIERIVAVALVAILSAAIAPSVLNNIAQGRVARAQSDVQAVAQSRPPHDQGWIGHIQVAFRADKCYFTGFFRHVQDLLVYVNVWLAIMGLHAPFRFAHAGDLGHFFGWTFGE